MIFASNHAAGNWLRSYDAAQYDRSDRRRRIEFSAGSDEASFLFRVLM
jgi:hypothetical protein